MSYADLWHNGYHVVPQRVAEGATGQQPGSALVKFKDRDYDIDEVMKWEDRFEEANIALVTGRNNVVALDVDCVSPKVANKILRACRERWPEVPVRNCNPPKFVMLFKADEALVANVKNGHSDVYKVGGDTMQIEYMGSNKLITMFGTHRKTHNEYRWGRGPRNPFSTPADQLPVISREDVMWVFSLFNINVPKLTDWVLTQDQRLTKYTTPAATQGDALLDAQLTPVYSNSDLNAWLDNYNGDTYEQWRDAGMAIHAHYKGAIEGLLLWDKWSGKFDNWQEGACAEAWENFTVDGGITVATIERAVTKEVKDEATDKMQVMLDNLVLIKSGQMVGNLAEPSAEAILSAPEARLYYSNAQIKQIQKDGGVKYVDAFPRWLKHAARRDVHGTTFKPCRDRIIQEDEDGKHAEYWNLYVSPEHELLPKMDNQLLRIFLDHMAYIFDGEGDAEWMLDWMADLVQNPLQRPTTTPLHVNTNTRTGRGWLTQFISRLVGIQNTGEVKLETIADHSAKNGYMNNTLVVFVHEIKPTDSSKMYKMYDALKTLLTENYMNIDVKWGASGMQRVYARFFLMSNNLTCLPVQEGDKRLNVMRSDALPKEQPYYDRLYKALENKAFMNACYTYLHNRVYDHAKLTSGRMTPAKREMLRLTRSPTASAFAAAKEKVGMSPFTKQMLNDYIARHLTVSGHNVLELNDGEIRHLYSNTVTSGVILRHEGEPVAVHTFHGAPAPTQATLAEGITEAKLKLSEWN